MPIGVISDTHGDLRSWQKGHRCWDHPELVLHCGDVLGGHLSYLADEIRASVVPVLVSRGNCDPINLGDILNWPVMSSYVTVFWNSKLILMAHGDHFAQFKRTALRCHADLAISGHTHVAALNFESGTIFLNPGSASLPRGTRPASTAVIDSDKISVLSLDGEPLVSMNWSEASDSH